MDQQEDVLPKWFRAASKIARHCTWGVCTLYMLLQLNFINENLNKTFLEWIDIFLVIIAVPAFIFSGSDIIKIISKINKKNDS